MTPSPDSPSGPDRGTLDAFLAVNDSPPLAMLTDDAWRRIRWDTGRRLSWRFCTLRNLLVQRGHFARDAYDRRLRELPPSPARSFQGSR